jgi:hypothetical protein
VTIPITVMRTAGFIETVRLAAEAPDGFTAALSTRSLFGQAATAASATVTVPAGLQSGTYDVTIDGSNWGRTRSATATITVESDPPVAEVPRVTVASGTRFDTTTVAGRASWPAATDATSGISAYQVQWSIDGQAWGGTTTLGRDARFLDRTFTVGRTYAVRIRARDGVGNWSAWAGTSADRVRVTQDTSGAWSRHGTWNPEKDATASAGSTRAALYQGAWSQVTLTASAVAVVAPCGPDRGTAQLWVDGVLVATVDLHRTTVKPRRVVAIATFATRASHTVRWVVLGTTGRPRVDLDALVAIG